MIYISDEELDKMTEEGKKDWISKKMLEIHGEYGTSYLPILDVPFMFQCLKCKAHYTIKVCSNCEREYFEIGSGSEGLGVFCKYCDKGFSNWTCANCGCENPTSATLFLLKKNGGCFIATAVYGNEFAKEVMALKYFRDNYLQKNKIGQISVKFYYFFSPSLSEFIKNKQLLKSLLKKFILQPIVNIIKRHYSI